MVHRCWCSLVVYHYDTNRRYVIHCCGDRKSSTNFCDFGVWLWGCNWKHRKIDYLRVVLAAGNTNSAVMLRSMRTYPSGYAETCFNEACVCVCVWQRYQALQACIHNAVCFVRLTMQDPFLAQTARVSACVPQGFNKTTSQVRWSGQNEEKFRLEERCALPAIFASVVDSYAAGLQPVTRLRNRETASAQSAC